MYSNFPKTRWIGDKYPVSFCPCTEKEYLYIYKQCIQRENPCVNDGCLATGVLWKLIVYTHVCKFKPRALWPAGVKRQLVSKMEKQYTRIITLRLCVYYIHAERERAREKLFFHTNHNIYIHSVTHSYTLI